MFTLVMSFDSEKDMEEAWKSEIYAKATKIRENIMGETAVGVHVTSINEIVSIVPSK